MHKYMKMMPIEQMEHITRQQLCDNFDSILKRIDKEKIGFVILNEKGENGHVICPAEWMDICFNKDFGCIIINALRYAISNDSYMPEVVIEFIRKHIKALDKTTIDIAIHDIENELNGKRVNDSSMWVKLKDELIIQLKTVLETSNGGADK